MALRTVSRSAWPGGHWSNTMQMSLPSLRWMPMTTSGEKKRGEPSIGLWNATPSSVILASCANENT